MRVYFDYPLATVENMKAVQNAIDAGTNDVCDLIDMFGENVVWDCVVMLSGNEDTPWAVFDRMDGHEQAGIECWQGEIIDDYISKCQILGKKELRKENRTNQKGE